jgi:hypothetical protein
MNELPRERFWTGPLTFSITKAEQFLLLVALYTAPMHKVAWDVGIRIRIIYVCAGLLLLLGALRFLRGVFRLPSWSGPAFLGIMWIVLATFISIIKVVDYSQYWRAALAILIALYITVYLLSHIKDPEVVALFWVHWWRAGLIMVIYGLAQWGLWWFLRFDLDRAFLGNIGLNLRKTGLDAYTADLSRVTSLALDTNNFSLYLSTLVPLGFYRIISAQTQRKRLTAIIFSTLILLVDILTLSRSGLGGFMIAFVLVSPILCLTILRSQRFRYGIIILIASIVVLGIMLFLVFSPSYWMNLIQLRLQLSSGTSLHIKLLVDSFDLFLRSPVVGWGTNQFGPLYSLYYRPDLPPIWNTHNGFATIGVETGLLGLLGYGGLFIYTIGITLKVWAKDASKRLFLLFLLWGYIAYLAGNMGYNSFGFPNFWVYQALLIASANVWLKERDATLRDYC